jgi:hypothetical protein
MISTRAISYRRSEVKSPTRVRAVRDQTPVGGAGRQAADTAVPAPTDGVGLGAPQEEPVPTAVDPAGSMQMGLWFKP